jgi:regulator of protease activity HflC (stomatin/prohibitin superfamily)
MAFANLIQIFALFTIALLVTLILRRRFRSVTVHDYERGLLFKKGRLDRILDAGRYWLVWGGREITVVDLRERILEVAAQEIPTKDRVPVKVSLAITYRVTDPRATVTEVESYVGALYLAGQLALRSAVSRVEFEELLANRTLLDETLIENVRPAAERIGAHLEQVTIKDITVSSDLKRALADVAKAQAEARAKLERARGESAALRNLANAARLFQDHPGLRELRFLETAQVAAEKQGNTLVLGLSKEDLGSLNGSAEG